MKISNASKPVACGLLAFAFAAGARSRFSSSSSGSPWNRGVAARAGRSYRASTTGQRLPKGPANADPNTHAGRRIFGSYDSIRSADNLASKTPSAIPPADRIRQSRALIARLPISRHSCRNKPSTGDQRKSLDQARRGDVRSKVLLASYHKIVCLNRQS